MTESNHSKTNFAGTYFDRDSILRLANLANVFAWVSLLYYAAQAILALTIFTLQLVRGLTVCNLSAKSCSFLWIWRTIPDAPRENNSRAQAKVVSVDCKIS